MNLFNIKDIIMKKHKNKWKGWEESFRRDGVIAIKKSICIACIEPRHHSIKSLLEQKRRLKEYCLENDFVCVKDFYVASLEDEETIEEIAKYVENFQEPVNVIFMEHTDMTAYVADCIMDTMDGHIHLVENQTVWTLHRKKQ